MRIRRLFAFLALLIPLPAAAQDLKSNADALGIKTVLVPAGTKIGDLVKTEGKTLIEVPLATLESRLERAVEQQAAAKRQPRLVKSTYRAELVGNHLAAGSGDWIVDHPGSSPAIMPLTSFNLALKQPRLSGEQAVLGDLDGTNLGLWVEKPGTQSLVFDWSLRGTPSIHGIAFDLRLPPCPLIAIDLKLPADHTLTLPKTIGMMTGPLATENPAFKLWRLQVAGRSQIELVVRRGNEAVRTPQLFAASETRVQFSPEQTLYDCDVHVEVIHASVAELTFDVDASLIPFNVFSRQAAVQSWRVESAGNRSLVKVQLQEPLLGSPASFRLRFAGPRWTEQEAMLPRIDLVGAVNRGETLKLHLHPDQHLERWDAGAYRLVNSSTDADGSQVLSLADARPGKGPMPRFLLRTQGVDFTVNQEARWRIDPGSMTLVSELQYDISRGQLFDLQVRLPKNAPWRVVGVELQPPDALQKWSIAGGILHVDLQRGITPRTDCKLSIQLQDERDKSLTKPKIVDFPDIEPIGAIQRQGSLAVLTDGHQRVSLVQSNLPTSTPEPALAKDPRLQFYFAYRQVPVQGKVRLAPQQPIVQARTQQQVTLLADVAKVKASVTIEPIVGQPSYVDLFFSDATGEPWKLEAKGVEIASQERLPLVDVAALGARLAATNWRGVFAAAMLDAPGPVWRVHFREPLAKAAVLTVQRDLPRQIPANAPPPILTLDRGIGLAAETAVMRMESDWSIPIVVPLDAERVDGELALLPSGISLRSVQSHGLESASTKGLSAKGPAGSAFARVFRFRHSGLLDAPSLTVKTQRRPRDDASQAIVELAELTTSVDPAGNVAHHLSASVWNWRARDFRIVLPPGASIVGARLNHVDLDAVARHNGPGGVELSIPMTQESGAQSVEVVYRGEPPSWFGSLGRNVFAPLPTLPSNPLLVRREVRLAPGWLPLWQEDAFSFDRHAPAREALRNVWTAGEGLVDEVFPSSPPVWLEPQRLSLLGAEGALRRLGAREMPLAEAFGRLLFEAKSAPPVIVIDLAACRALRLSPKTVTDLAAEGSAPFWDKLGLAYVPTPHAALLTSKNRAPGWARAIRDDDATGTLLADAVRQAAERGQDASGRFQAADFWLRASGSGDRSAAAAYVPQNDDMTVWQPLAGHGAGDSFVVVRRVHLRGLATLLGLLVVGGGFLLRPSLSAIRFFRAVWIALAACLVAFAVVPTSIRELTLGPCVAVGVLLVVAYRRLLAREAAAAPATTKRSTAAKATGLVLLAALSTLSVSEAQAPAPRVIYLVAETATEKSRALASPEALRWLDDLDKQVRPALDDVVVLAARYQARWERNAVAVSAEFDVVAFKGKAPLVVPLAGVDLLGGSRLGDAPVLPVVAPAGKTGYQIVVPEKGSHRLTMSFLVRPLASGDVKFTGPRTPCTSLQFVAPIKLGVPRLARCWGQEILKTDAKSGEQTLEAQLGAEAVVHVQGLGGAAPAGSLQVRELYFWDIRPGNRSAQAVLAYVASGEVSSLEIRLPSSLEIRSVDLAEPVAGKPPGAIKTWSVTPPQGDNRLLKIDFLQPMTGSFEVLLGMTPRAWGGAGAIDLRLPFPARTAFADGMIGVRLDDPDASEKAQFLGVAAIAPDAFVKEWTRLSQRDIGAPLRAFSFARAQKNVQGAALEVTPHAAKLRAQADVSWTAQAKSVDLAAKFNVTAAEDFYLLPINLADNVVLRDVQGADVHHWSRLGNTLQVWLVGPKKKTSLTLLGWAPCSFPKATPINLPAPSVMGAIAEPATLTLASAAAYFLEPKAPPILDADANDGTTRRYRSPTGGLPTAYQLRPQVSVPEYQSLTTAEEHEGVCTVATHVHGRVDHGDFPELRLRQATVPGLAPRLLSSIAGVKVKHSASPHEHKWTVMFPPGTPQQVSFSIVGQVPLKLGEKLKLPDLRIDRGGQLTDRIVALAGAHPATETPLKLASVRSLTKELYPWPLEHARLRAASAQFGKWPAAADSIAVQPNEEVSAAPVQPLSARHLVLVGQPDRWLHRMTWSLWVKSGHDLEIALPAGATFEAAFVDDQPATPRQSGAESISLPLSAGQKPRTVVVCWSYPAAKESFAQPLLAAAELSGLEPIAVEGTLSLPPGWKPANGNWIASVSASLLAELQAEQRTLGVVGEDLAQSSRAATLKPNLESFALIARQAQYRIAIEPDPQNGETLDAQLKLLIDVERKQAKTLGLEAARIQADKIWLAPPRPSFAGADAGAPLPWTGSEPRVVLRTSKSPAPHMTLMPMMILIFVLSFWPIGLKSWTQLWPEQLAAIALLSMAFGGFSLLGTALIAFAVVCRGLSLANVARRLISQRAS